MNNNNRSFFILPLIMIIGIVSSLLGQGMENVEIKPHQVTDNIYMLEGRGGNIGACFGEDGVFLIDDQFAPLTAKIQAAVASFSDQPVRFVINTHWHGDHTGGNENFGEAGAIIVAHDNVHSRMSEGLEMNFFGRKVAPAAPGALPIVTFSETITFHLNGQEIHAIHVANAHTAGDALIHFPKANVIHMGDTFFNGGYPYIDVADGGSINGVIQAAEKVMSMSDESTKIIPGHGPLANKADLQAYHNMLVQIRDKTAALIKAGKSLEEALAAKPTADLDEKWGGGFINPETIVKLLYSSLKGKSN